MTTRRTFIKFGAGVGFGVLTPWGAIVREAAAATVHRHAKPALTAKVMNPSVLQKFVDALPLPATMKPVGRRNGDDYYEVVMTQFQQQLHKDMLPTTLWGYGGSFPGPTLEARVGQTIHVKWINNLPDGDYLISGVYDKFLQGTDKGEPHAKTVVHVHGAHVPPAGDGYPEAWFTRGFARKGPAWATDVYAYPNKQDAATLWYHDHTMGQTRLNVYAGLAGFYLLRDNDEKNDDNGNDGRGDKPDNKKLSALPHGKFEVAIVIQDRIFDTDGSLLFPIRDPSQVLTSDEHPGTWVPEFFGDTILVNGKVWPYLDVAPRKYRFRILNGSNARFYNLTLDSGQTFTQIAAEQGFFRKPVTRQNILLAPGERADVIIDFAKVRGNIMLQNDAKAPFPDGDPVDPNTTGQIMQFRTNKRLEFADTSDVPAALNVGAMSQTQQDEDVPTFRKQADQTRNMVIVEWKDRNDEPIIGLLNNRRWTTPITDKPKLGSVEIWNIINTTGDTHPIHLHLVKFKLISRQAFAVDRYLKEWLKNGETAGEGPSPIAPAAFLLPDTLVGPDSNETGFKDTVRANPGEVTTIIMRFDDYTGKYPWHCHIVDHEDNEMMQQFEVVKR